MWPRNSIHSVSDKKTMLLSFEEKKELVKQPKPRKMRFLVGPYFLSIKSFYFFEIGLWRKKKVKKEKERKDEKKSIADFEKKTLRNAKFDSNFHQKQNCL